MPTWAIRAFFFAGLRIYCVSVATRAAGTYLSTPPCPRASFLVSASNRQKIALVALFRIRSIRALVAPISHSLHTALGLRLCARAGALRAYAYAVALLPAAISATFGCSLDDMPFGNNSARFLEYRCKRNERRLDRFGFENTRVHKKLSFFCLPYRALLCDNHLVVKTQIGCEEVW